MRVLIALDGSAISDDVLAAVAPWLKEQQIEPLLITVMNRDEVHATATAGGHYAEPGMQGVEGDARPASVRGASRGEPGAVESRSQALDRARTERLAELNEIASRHLDGITYGALAEGDEHTARAISERARAIGASMIVTGRTGAPGSAARCWAAWPSA